MTRILRSIARAWGLLASSLATTLVQLIAIFLFDPSDFGTFSLLYIALSIGNAAAYSVVCEPWSSRAPSEETWEQYATILALIALASGVPVILLGAAVGEFVVGLVLAVAVMASVYRIGSRYYSVVVRHREFISGPDTATVLVLIVLMALMGQVGFSLLTVSSAWAIAALVGLFLSERPARIATTKEIRSWFTERWSTIKYLLVDASLTEAGTAGVPLGMAPIMGFGDFGIYRSASSMTSPVRMVLNPLRPNIARMTLSQAIGLRSAGFGIALAVAAGSFIFVGLEAVGFLGLFDGSTIAALSNLPVAVAVFVGSYAVTVFSYFSLRTQVGGKPLVVYRVVQLVLFAVLPIGGYYLAGVSGAIWGRSASSIVTVVLSWAMMGRTLAQRRRAGSE